MFKTFSSLSRLSLATSTLCLLMVVALIFPVAAQTWAGRNSGGIGSPVTTADCASAFAHNHDKVKAVEIDIQSWTGCTIVGKVNGVTVPLFMDVPSCVLHSKVPGKLRASYCETCGAVLELTDGPVLSPCAQVITLTVATAPAGKAIVNWQMNAAPGSQDWIGLYLSSEPDGSRNFQPGKWVYVTASTGTFITDAPANGNYEWRYLLANGYQNTARSAAFVIGPGPTPSPTPVIEPTPSPTPLPGVTYDFARFDILGSTVNQQDELLASIGEQGYGTCWVFVQTRYFYCLRPRNWTVKFDWARWPFPNGQPLRDAQATQVGQEGYSNVFVLSGQLRASRPRP